MGNNQIQLMDVLNLMSLFIELLNLDANLTQNDKQELIEDMHQSLHQMVDDIHDHLQKQDQKIDDMYRMISDIHREKRR